MNVGAKEATDVRGKEEVRNDVRKEGRKAERKAGRIWKEGRKERVKDMEGRTEERGEGCGRKRKEQVMLMSSVLCAAVVAGEDGGYFAPVAVAVTTIASDVNKSDISTTPFFLICPAFVTK
jgi:hypothetical protein